MSEYVGTMKEKKEMLMRAKRLKEKVANICDKALYQTFPRRELLLYIPPDVFFICKNKYILELRWNIFNYLGKKKKEKREV